MTGKGNIYVSTCVYLYRAYGSFCDSNINYTYIYIEKEKSHWCGFRRVIFYSRVWWPIRVTSIIIAWMSTKYDFYPSVSMGCPCFGGYVFNYELDLLAWMSTLQFLMVLNVPAPFVAGTRFQHINKVIQRTRHITHIMMTSSNGNIFRVTGPLCGEFTGHRWIPLTKASDTGLWCCLWFEPEKPLSKQS